MFCNDNLRRDEMDINITNQNVNVNDNMNMNYNEMEGYVMPMQPQMGSVMSPIIEPGRERVVQRNIVHEVKQVSPFM